ncbi:MAG: hypothetical protein II929_03645, partial [Succinivibrio sp.]|nr:hypothetical protein [Succinivibrio sp.]
SIIEVKDWYWDVISILGVSMSDLFINIDMDILQLQILNVSSVMGKIHLKYTTIRCQPIFDSLSAKCWA